MAFVVPIIGAAFSVASIGTALLNIGISLAVGALARALSPKPKPPGGLNGTRLSLRLDSNADREVIIGVGATAGTLAYHNTYGPNGNDYLQLVFVLADHRCDGLETFYINGVAATWDAETGEVDEFPDKMWVRFFDGAPDQEADPELVDNGDGRWTEDDVGTGLTYASVTLKYDAKLYKDGLPKFLWVVRGALLYDIRLDSTAGGTGSHRWDDPDSYEWSDNPIVAAYNWRRGIYTSGERVAGMNTPAIAMPFADWSAAANACDETVVNKDTSTAKRYTANGVISTSQTHREVIQDFMAACAGIEVDSGGVLKPRPGVAQSPVGSITDSDLVAAPNEITAKRPRSELVNAVFGSFADPAQQFTEQALPPRLSPDDEAEDGGIRLEQHYALDLVTSATQGQRTLEIFRRRARRQLRVKCTLRARWSMVEAGDWIVWTSARYGWDTKTFEIVNATPAPDFLSVQVLLREIDAGAYGFVPSNDELDVIDPQPVQVGGSTFDVVTPISLVGVVITSAAGAQRPGLQYNWTPVTDATVIALAIEYRRVGDTTALTQRTDIAEAGSYTWIDGVQGGTQYEARSRPITLPERATDWTTWTAMASATQSHVVDVSSITNSVAPDTVTPAMLDPQARFELSLTTSASDVLGGVSDIDDRAFEWAQLAAEASLRDTAQRIISDTQVLTRHQVTVTATEALATQITEVTAALDDASAAIIDEATARATADTALASDIATVQAAVDTASAAISTEATARATADTALASDIATVQAAIDTASAAISTEATARATADTALAASITTLTSEVDGATASITEILRTEDGGSSLWMVATTAAGEVTGLVRLNGEASESTFDVVVDKFRASLPGETGGAAIQVFEISNVDGTPQVTIRADLIADGAIAARSLAVSTLSAITADLGEVTAGLIRSADNLVRIDLDAGSFTIDTPPPP